MTMIQIQHVEGEDYEVEVTQKGTTTTHRVTVPAAFLDLVGLGDRPPQAVLMESFTFLLKREPNTSILGEFALGDIATYFPEYPEVIKKRFP